MKLGETGPLFSWRVSAQAECFRVNFEHGGDEAQGGALLFADLRAKAEKSTGCAGDLMGEAIEAFANSGLLLGGAFGDGGAGAW
jgi:hypothetical protein